MVELLVAGRVVADYAVEPDIDPLHGPRPYLHPVRTLSGLTVTDVLPEDHRWHLGVSVAMQDVNGTNLWGGRTYVRGAGYTWLDDHGRIVHDEWLSPPGGDGSRLAERLRWLDPAGRTLLVEERTLVATPATRDGAVPAGAAPAGPGNAAPAGGAVPGGAVPRSPQGDDGLGGGDRESVGERTPAALGGAAPRLPHGGDGPGDGGRAEGGALAAPGESAPRSPQAGAALADGDRDPVGWILDFAFTLTAPEGSAVTLGSPATNGRPGGAGYGGFFWRLTPGEPEAFTSTVEGEEKCNGSADPWLAVRGAGYTLVFSGLEGEDRWFVRAADYPGVCAALAWERPLTIEPGGALSRRYRVLVVDGALDRETIQ